MSDTPPDDSPPPAETDSPDDSLYSPSEPRRRSRWLVAGLTGGLAVVLAVGLVGTRVIGVWGEGSEPNAEATGSPSPTEPPSPFDGTPAEELAEGADGIVLPEAEAVGDFTANEVADALELVRDALVAARLDESMLIDHDQDSLLTLLIADQQAALREAFGSGEFGAFPTQVADSAVLAAVPPRVEGQVSYEAISAGPDRSLIEVVTRFVWVYAFERADTESGTHIVVVRDELVWQVRGEPWLESSQGLSLYDVALHVWGADCDAHDKGLLGPDDEGVAGLDEDAEADAIFDPAQPLDSKNSC